MEGSYNKVWNARSNVPAEEYAFFIDILMGTIRLVLWRLLCFEGIIIKKQLKYCRNEIASCSEKAYQKLPIADAATLLYFKTPKEVTEFATEVKKQQQQLRERRAPTRKSNPLLRLIFCFLKHIYFFFSTAWLDDSE